MSRRRTMKWALRYYKAFQALAFGAVVAGAFQLVWWRIVLVVIGSIFFAGAYGAMSWHYGHGDFDVLSPDKKDPQ